MARTIDEYLADLPADKRAAIAAVRDVILAHLPRGYEEQFGYGGITYAIPLEAFPNTYNKQPLCYVALAAHKNFNSLYLMSAYGDAAHAQRLKDGFKAANKKLDMGKSCIHFRSADDLELEVIGELIASLPPAKWIRIYEASRK